MARLLKSLEPISLYMDRKFMDGQGTPELYVRAVRESTTVYVGNLAFHTTEEQIHELFSKCGLLRRIVMGLDRTSRTPCGFCFVEYHTRADTESCVKYLNGAQLDDRAVRIDIDWRAPRRPAPPALTPPRGFVEGRQYGRGKSGGQVRDEYRTDYDLGRGGYGKMVADGLKERHAPQASPPLPPPPPPAQGTKRGREEAPGDSNPRFRPRRDEDDE